MSDLFKCHSSKQIQAITSNAPITALITGIQWGKSSSGAVWLKRKIYEDYNPNKNFIITAPTYKIMNQSTIPAFLKHMEGFGELKKQEAVFEEYGGCKIYLRTGTEPDSVVGITDVYAIWGDEAGKYGKYFWENIQGRSSFKQAPIMLTTTPYSMNWLYSDIFKKADDKEIKLITADSIENPHFPQAEYDRKKLSMDPRRFKMMYQGSFDKMHGRVYDCFSDKENIIDAFQLPIGTQYFGGIDWGYTDPFVIKVRAITPEGMHYAVSEFYKTGMTLTDMVIVAKQKQATFGIKMFYADPSQPGYIEEFNRNGITTTGAENDIRVGIDRHYELIRTRKYKVFKNLNPYTLDEYETYHYPEPEDLGPDDNSKDSLPVDQANHTMDTERYITMAKGAFHEKKAPFVPGDETKKLTRDKYIEKLKKKGEVRNYEEW